MTADLSFGRWLQQRRKTLDLTQAELGLRVGYARVTIHKIETHALRPSRQMAEKLADELGIGLDEREAFLRFARTDIRAGLPLGLLPRLEPTSLAGGHSLPLVPTRFIGREEEVRAARTLLCDHARLLTLTGAAGMGKTRLGIEIAAGLVETFRDGVWFVDLAPLADPDLVMPTVATVLRVRADPSQPLQTTLLGALRDRHLLLVLDNCEHLVDACACLIDEILRGSANVSILATSRVALRVAGETSRSLLPLSVPPLGQLPLPEELEEYEAGRLFIERATAVAPNFFITDQNAWALVQICQRLDGMPLALELAAARSGVLTVEQIAARLDDRFRLLTLGNRTALPRHQTLRATIDWSYNLLSQRDRLVFQRLAVFTGSWTLEAGEAVAAGGEIDRAQVLDSLTALVDQSLVVVENHDGERRYRLLESLREYAGERLRESGKTEDMRERHLGWYVEVAERADAEIPGTGQQPGLRQLEADHDNLRTALEWGVQHDPERALDLAGCLAEFWRRGGHHAEGRRWLNGVLAAADSSSAQIRSRARVLLGAGYLAGDAGEFGPDQVFIANESVRLFRDAGDQRALIEALQHLGRCVMESDGDSEQVQSVFDESLHIARTMGDQHGIGFALANLGHLAWCNDKRPEARQLCEQSIVHIRASGDFLFTGLVLGLVGWYAMVDGDLRSAKHYKEEGLSILRSLEAKEAIGLALLGLAHVARRSEDPTWLRTLLDESAPLLRETDSPGVADWLTFIGQIHVEQGAHAHGVRLLAAGESQGPRFGSLRFLLYQMPRDELDACLASARAALGEDAFHAAWIEGKGITPRQALATAWGIPTPAERDSTHASAK